MLNDAMSSYYHQQKKSRELFESGEDISQQEDFVENMQSRKMTEVEKWYAKELDQGETIHISKHMIRNSHDVKSLDVKIMELRENPDNL